MFWKIANVINLIAIIFCAAMILFSVIGMIPFNDLGVIGNNLYAILWYAMLGCSNLALRAFCLKQR